MDEVPGGGCKDVPNHVAIIMDGNGRWAQKRHLPAAAGHRAGAKKVREISEACVEHDIKNLTLFAFSTENWQRPDKEVGGLMDLMRYVMKTDIEDLRKKGVRLSIVGEREAFDTDIVDLMEKCEESTAHNEKLNLNVAVNFGGRWDIVQAVRKIMTKHILILLLKQCTVVSARDNGRRHSRIFRGPRRPHQRHSIHDIMIFLDPARIARLRSGLWQPT